MNNQVINMKNENGVWKSENEKSLSVLNTLKTVITIAAVTTIAVVVLGGKK